MDARTDPQLLNDVPDAIEMHDLIIRLMRGVNAEAFRIFGNKVLTGPFVQMIIPEWVPHCDDGNAGVKLVGCYEHELHESLLYLEWRKPDVVINVGCAEGYYAIGLARLLKVPIYAFDLRVESLAMCEEYAAKNGVAVSLGGGVQKPEQLRFPDMKGHRFYLFDCEACEQTLVDPDLCPELINADLIVECHDFMVPGIGAMLADRLSATHRIEMIRPRMPDYQRFDFLNRNPSVLSMLIVTEKRPMPCYWLACWANRRGG